MERYLLQISILCVIIIYSANLQTDYSKSIRLQSSQTKDIREGGIYDSCGPHLGQPGFDSINPPRWKQYDSQQTSYMKEVETCVLRFEMWKGHWSMKGGTQKIDTTLGMLDCQEEYGDIQQSLRNWAKQYRRIWFVGNSVLGQQFDVLQCMLDPQATLNRTELSRFFIYDHASDAINRSTIVEADETEQAYLYTHENSSKFLHNESSPSSTSFERVHHGYLFDEQEKTLYETAFPTIIKLATSNDAIVMNAGAHYDHTRMEPMENTLRLIAKESHQTNASIFFIEPIPENWKTSNGMYGGWPRGHKYTGGCHQLNEAQINGEDDIDGVFKMPPLSELSNASMNVYTKLYPELSKTTSNSRLTEIAPKASWRCDLTRSIFGRGSSISKDDKVKLIPIFWQLVVSNVTSNVHEGDCTHRSLSAIVNMNIQMVRHMTKG